MVNGLESRHDLNGKSGKLGAYDSDRGRWAVQVPGYGNDGEKIWAHAANLCSVKGLEGRLSVLHIPKVWLVVHAQFVLQIGKNSIKTAKNA